MARFSSAISTARCGPSIWQADSSNGHLPRRPDSTRRPHTAADAFISAIPTESSTASMRADGKKLWTFKTEAEIDRSANFWHDDVLFGSQDSSLYCLDATSGKKLWTLKTADQIRCPPTVVDDRAFLAACDGNFYIIDVTLGKTVKTVNIERADWQYSGRAGLDRLFWHRRRERSLPSIGKKQKFSGNGATRHRARPYDPVPLSLPKRSSSAAATSESTRLDPLSGKKIWEVPGTSESIPPRSWSAIACSSPRAMGEFTASTARPPRQFGNTKPAENSSARRLSPTIGWLSPARMG